MKIYTKKGDKGEALSPTGLKGKDSLVFELFGTIDELQSVLAIVYEEIKERGFVKVEEQLLNIMQLKYELSSAIYLPKDFQESESLKLENLIDELSLNLKPLTGFILPIGNKAVAYIHFSRVITRRLERTFIKWIKLEKIDFEKYENIAKYLNRLSDYLFTLARYMNGE